MRIIVPWKPVVIVWGLLSGLVLFGFLGSSVPKGKTPFVPSVTNVHTVAVKPAVASTVPQAKHPHKAPTSGR
jgi:hypothetical protein